MSKKRTNNRTTIDFFSRRFPDQHVDYAGKLSEAELEFMAKFQKEYVGGETEDKAEKRAANHRRYMAQGGDALSRTTPDGDEALQYYPSSQPDALAILLARESEVAKK